VEIAVRNDDLGTVARDALYMIAPAARGLDRGLDRFGSGVHGQRGVEPRDPAKLREERT